MKLAFAVSLALAVTLSVSGAAHSQQQLKALPVNSYVLTNPDGTPLYLVQHSKEWETRKVYHVVKPAEQENSNPPNRGRRSRRSATENRVNSTRSWEQFNRQYGFTEM
jgi:hypothetical protein